MAELKEDVRTYLARIRKTIADSKNMVALTREQVMAMRFSDAQKRAVDAELKRRGLDPLEWWGEADAPEPEAERELPDADVGMASDAELENRQRKFGMMMKPFQI